MRIVKHKNICVAHFFQNITRSAPFSNIRFRYYAQIAYWHTSNGYPHTKNCTYRALVSGAIAAHCGTSPCTVTHYSTSPRIAVYRRAAYRFCCMRALRINYGMAWLAAPCISSATRT